jgi:hypothetical protein
MKIYSIELAVFNPNEEQYQPGYIPGGDILLALMNTKFFPIFYGAVCIEEDGEGRKTVTGRIREQCTYSEIIGFELSEENLTITKIYRDRFNKPIVEYIFSNRIDGIWKGMMRSSNGESKVSNCKITEIPPSFFEPIVL